jgi:hypothetical protein
MTKISLASKIKKPHLNPPQGEDFKTYYHFAASFLKPSPWGGKGGVLIFLLLPLKKDVINSEAKNPVLMDFLDSSLRSIRFVL